MTTKQENIFRKLKLDETYTNDWTDEIATLEISKGMQR